MMADDTFRCNSMADENSPGSSNIEAEETPGYASIDDDGTPEYSSTDQEADDTPEYRSLGVEDTPENSNIEADHNPGNSNLETEGTPKSTKRSGRDGHDQNKPRLLLEILHGFRKFAPIAELIRLLNQNVDETPSSNARFMNDFVKFRDFMAHKGLSSLDIIFYQMVGRFVIFCGEKMKLKKTSHQPKTTKTLAKSSFARMSDINVVVCADWFLHLWSREKLNTDDTSRWLNKAVRNSSFSKLKFEVDENSIWINGEEDEDEKRKKTHCFNSIWVKNCKDKVANSSVTYSEDEINKFLEFYDNIKQDVTYAPE